ncbi:MAG TPA: hypothetical protein VMF89_13670, partial [Polyangiales bacterium]|nr:hypothetical protein [Polyangiales bacterium]
MEHWSISTLLRGIPVVMLLSLTTLARADGPLSPEASYDALVTAGLEAFEADRASEARAAFERAHALQPSARTLRVLGLTAVALDW